MLLTVLVALSCAIEAYAQADGTGVASFVVLQSGVRVGAETVSVTRSGGNWVISGSGRTAAPVDLVTSRFEAIYAGDWQPQRLVLEGSARGQSFMLETTFGVTTARTEMTQGTERGATAHQISPRALVLPASFFGAYEALALRLPTTPTGARLPIYVAPDGEISVNVNRVTPKRVSVGAQGYDLREYGLTVNATGGAIPIEIWIDERGRLARLLFAATGIVVLREDLASVMAREERVHREGDEDLFVPANGFSLSATISKPAAPASGRRPAIVLVTPPGPEDRDLTLFGVSIYGQLAGSLADAGYLVARYDARGVGRSGGRTENASINEYVDDLTRLVGWLRNRKDVDGDRIAAAGYGEGALIAMMAATKEKRIKAVALLAAPGRTGREVTLEQQRQLLARLNLPESEKALRVAAQTRIMDVATTGTGWETLSPDMRARASSPWFRSWLTVDPAAVISKMSQPILVVHGALDREIDPANAERLESLARARKNAAPGATRRVTLDKLNHLLVPATTGEMDEYTSLTQPTVSPEVATTIRTWLADVLPARR